jgi:hypothetical protein
MGATVQIGINPEGLAYSNSVPTSKLTDQADTQWRVFIILNIKKNSDYVEIRTQLYSSLQTAKFS